MAIRIGIFLIFLASFASIHLLAWDLEEDLIRYSAGFQRVGGH